MSVKNRERQIFEPRISRTYMIIYSDVPWVFLDHLEILFLWKRFHGVSKDEMEEESGDDEIKKNFLDHNIKKLLLNEWGIECNAPFKHVFR